ncbi:MAG: hypothetical protein JXL67_04390, partial [Calditrichaeota bacterium]|nr:hypothetical protein [Calditrichota bacterium]
IPSGRCIQKEDYKKNKNVFLDLSDSTDYDNHKNYFTKNGRVVHGGGGIKPDIEVTPEKVDQYVAAIWAEGHFFQFTVDYLADHPEIDLTNGFTVTPEILNDFRSYLAEKKMTFEIEGEEELKSFIGIAQEENYDADLMDLVKVALQKLENEKEAEFDRNVEEVKKALESEFAEKLGGTSGRIATLLKYDETVDKALGVLKSMEEYNGILAVKN